MDRRQRKTREAIFNAFNRLLSGKRYSNITVQEILDEANIGRSTFYAHFETKDDLLKAMCSELFSHVVSDHLTGEATHDFSDTEDDTESIITHILYHLRDNGKNIIGILTCESGEIFLRYFKEYLNGVFADRYGEQIKRCQNLPHDLLLTHISSSFVELVNWWIKNDMKQSPEEIEGYFTSIIAPITERI